MGVAFSLTREVWRAAVQFSVDAPPSLHVYVCNCSICKMKNNYHFVVPESHFFLEAGKDKLTEYRFGTRTAQHLFCSVCGVQSFYRPRSNPGARKRTLRRYHTCLLKRPRRHCGDTCVRSPRDDRARRVRTVQWQAVGTHVCQVGH